jgi:glycosyltransferase involved in cell wall biosynthesis
MISSSCRRKRILMVVESFARGGAERQILALSEGLLQRGYEVRVFELIGVVPGQSTFEVELADLGVPLLSARHSGAPAMQGQNGSGFPELAQYASILPANSAALSLALSVAIGEFQPQVVNTWSDVAGVIAGFVAAAMNVPRVVIGQRVPPPPHYEYGEVVSELYQQAYRHLAADPRTVFVNQSAASARTYEDWIELPPGTVKVVYNGLSPSTMASGIWRRRDAYRGRFGLPEQAPVVGGLMRFSPEKDPELWIEAAAAIASVRPDAYFLLGGYGHGRIADELFQKADELGFGPRIVMPGAIIDVGPFYASLDAFLLTSRLENFGNVLIEAQAAGIPVVGPATGGVAEAMIDGVTGLLVADRSAESFAGAALRILGDRGWGERVQIEGPKFVAQKFSQQRMVDEMIHIYE